MTVLSEPILIVGMFDRNETLDAAGERLTFQGIDNAVYDETIVAEPFGGDYAGPIPAHPARIPSAITRRLSDSSGMIQEFKCRLADYPLSDEDIEAYALTFSRRGKFVFVEADARQADRATEILLGSRASVINCHG